MKEKNIIQPGSTNSLGIGKQYSYNEVVEFLDKNWTSNVNDTTLSCIKQLDNAFENVSQKVNTILVSGSNGKSLTTHFTLKLLQEEGLNVGAFYSPHILTYNERFSINKETIANKVFTEIANEVLTMADTLRLTPNSYEILTIMALLYFKKNNVDIAIMEVSDPSPSNATNICTPKIAAITRVIDKNNKDHADQATINTMLSLVKPGTYVVSADQSKLNLQTMQDMVTSKNGVWAMPIRKLAPLAYPFEQLHGRCAALAERIAYIYINTFVNNEETVLVNSLLTKQKGQRGRPTLEAKRATELNPKKTVEQFWKDVHNTLPGRFQLLDKEKPSVLLDNASNLDAFENVLLGIRLLHYQRPLKGLTVVLGCNQMDLNVEGFLKLLRYFFKKTSGQVIVCPAEPMPGQRGTASWDVEKITNEIKSMKIKVKSSKNFKDAFESAQKSVDERHGLVVITGSPSLLTEYWKYKGMKKL
jgi:dihydrofolate synthase / folylpolyglutamate synthase